jgi:Protein of unknown function (DUF2797)
MVGEELNLPFSGQTRGRTLLAGYGCNERGPYLVVDDLERAPWQRHVIGVRGRTFTLTCCEERHCVGRHDLETGRAAPCPGQTSLAAAYEQCSDCFGATGFNPAFYNSPRISPQQRQRNLEPHAVYLVSFGRGALKVGMTHAPRRLSRLLEQGARLGSVIAELPNADLARELEASIALRFEVSEFVRAARKRQLLGVPLVLPAAHRELAEMLAHVLEHEPDIARPGPIQELDGYYFGTAPLPTSLTDLSETEPHSISGRCIGMIGDVLVVAQGERRYMLSIGESVGHRVRIEPYERENRFMGQLGLPF